MWRHDKTDAFELKRETNKEIESILMTMYEEGPYHQVRAKNRSRTPTTLHNRNTGRVIQQEFIFKWCSSMTKTHPVVSNEQIIINSFETYAIIDGVKQYITSALNEICRKYSDRLIEVKIQPPRKVYQHGCGQGCGEDKTAINTWYYSTTDMNEIPE